MARLFDGVNDCGALTVDLSGYSAITVSAWWYWDAFIGNNDLLFEYTDAGGANGQCFVNPNDPAAGGKLSMNMGQGAINWNDQFPWPTAGEYQSGVFEFNRAAPSNKWWRNGVQQLATGAAHAAGAYGNFANSRFNIMCRAQATLFGAGRMCEFAVWGGAVGATVARIIGSGQAGASPLQVLPDSLIVYVPMYGDSPEAEFIQHLSMSITGATVTSPAGTETMIGAPS